MARTALVTQSSRTSVRQRPYIYRTHHKKAGFTLPIAVLAGFAPMGKVVWDSFSGGRADQIPDQLTSMLTGWSPAQGNFDYHRMTNGLVPIGIGFLVHKFVGGNLGINRMLGQAHIPFIRI